MTTHTEAGRGDLAVQTHYSDPVPERVIIGMDAARARVLVETIDSLDVADTRVREIADYTREQIGGGFPPNPPDAREAAIERLLFVTAQVALNGPRDVGRMRGIRTLEAEFRDLAARIGYPISAQAAA